MILKKSAKTIVSKALTQQNMMAQVRMMSIMTQRKVVAQSLFGFQPMRQFSEEIEVEENNRPQRNREDDLKYAKLGQEVFLTGFDEDVSQEDFEEFFGKYGKLLKSKYLPKNDRFMGKFWVAFETPEIVD